MTATSPVDWRRAEQVAVAVASRSPASEVRIDPGWLVDEAIVAEDRIDEVTRLRSIAGAPRVEVLDRAGWIHANIEGFRRLLDPALDQWLHRRDGAARGGVAGRLAGALDGVTRQATGAELGALLGWMSTRVLGQYDLLVGSGSRDGVVYLVGPNLGRLEERFGFAPDDFRRWVLLHELTHRAQFTGVPWMRDHVTGLIEQVLTQVDPSPTAIADALRDAMRDLTDARQRLRDGGLAGLVATPAQRDSMARIGGVMSLLEGHGDVTMDRAGEGLVGDRERFGRILRERRRQANPLSRLVQRLTGLEAKLDQYAAGAGFIAAIEQAAGPLAVDECWTEVAALPTLDEIRAPADWLARRGLRAA